MDGSIFRAYDIRGVYPSEINEEAANKITETLAEKFFKKGTIVLGRDVRLSSPSLYRTVAKTLSRHSPEIKVIKGGLMTTPMLYFLVKRLKANGGIMITASHNPKNYNGMKMVDKNAQMITGERVLKHLTSNA